mgnify:CR=1 FL=1
MTDNTLKSGSLLKHGEYSILRVLGQGGFGITYEAEQVSLGRKVAVKEFFMKDICNRDGATSQVSVPSVGSKELVEKFRQKFLKEARMLAGLDHEHIVKIHDVFEENGTAYYVMEYLSGGSLDRKIKDKCAMPESEALGYIRQIADALSYLHSQNILHFDVKPSNVLLGKNGSAKLIDFGISKHYDEAGGQTSSTPVGISKGYAPLEQYKQGSDINSFTPATDIYALGATLYALLAGKNPPEASDVSEDGLPVIEGISPVVMHAIEKAMQPRRKERPQSVREFLALLDGSAKEDDDEETVVPVSKPSQAPKPNREPKPTATTSKREKSNLTKETQPKNPLNKYFIFGGSAILIVLSLILLLPNKKQPVPSDSLLINGMQECVVELESAAAEMEFKIEKSFEDRWTYSGVPEWCIATASEGKLALNVSQNSSKESRTATIEFRKNDGNIVLSQLTINQIPPQYFGVENGHEWVDLGLSVKWATCNVGASSPEDCGDYFAWGETQPKNDYEWNTLKYGTGGNNSTNRKVSKYNTHSFYGPVDNRATLELSDDAARANWGGSWRMPTKAEYIELINCCTWTRTTMNGKKGYRVKSKSNGNSIFLPAAGDMQGTNLDTFFDGAYWSSSLSSDYDDLSAYCLIFNSGKVDWSYHLRFLGKTVRPVYP